METETPIKQCITLLDKKVRNLEKRKAKLDLLRDKANTGEALDKDQQDAVSKYEVVTQNLEFSRELQKQFQQISNDADKQIRKQCKRDKIERQQLEVARLQVVLKLQSILDSLGNEQIRNDFKMGAANKRVLTDDDLIHLDEFYQAIVPSRDLPTDFQDQLVTAAEHLSLYLDASDKPIATAATTESNTKSGPAMTYEQLNELVEAIHSSGYFEKGANGEVPEQVTNVVVESKAVEEESVSKETLAQTEEPVETEEQEVQQWTQAPLFTQNGSHDYQEANNTYNQNMYNNQTSAYANQTNEYAAEVYTNAYTSQPVSEAYTNAYTNQATAVYTNSYRQRPLQEIVSSMQGNYNFLQDSEIDVDGNHVNQIVPNQSHYETSNSNKFMHMGSSYPNASVGTQNLPASSYPAGVGVSNMPVSELQYLEGHRHYAGSPAYMVVGPPPIPLPNEDMQTSADETHFVSKDLRQSEAQAEVPNTSMYEEEAKVAGKQGAGDIGPRTFAQTAGGNIQNYGGIVRSQQTGPRPNIVTPGQNKNINNLNRGPPRSNGDGRGYAGSGHSNQRPASNNNRGQEQPPRGYTRSNQMQATA